jgi:hypothetical protein
LTRGHVNFTDQRINRKLALYGSMGAGWVTLDMKDASDRVSVPLVERLFERTHLLEYLMDTRSSKTRLPNGELVTLNKFAPMGSALCFPIEALVFWSLAVSCIVNSDRSNTFLRNKIRRACSMVYVYGDDLIVHREDYAVLLQYFPTVGLMFNTKKCCTDGSFRESCGMDAYKGIDVTPTKCRTVWDSRSKDTQQYVSWVALSNQFYRGGYWELADYIRAEVLKKYPHTPTVDHDRDVAYICFRRLSATYYNCVSRLRFCKRHHRALIKAPVVSSATFTRKLTSYERLRWNLIRPSLECTSDDRRSLMEFARTHQAPAATAPCSFPVRNRVSHKLRWCHY